MLGIYISVWRNPFEIAFIFCIYSFVLGVGGKEISH